MRATSVLGLLGAFAVGGVLLSAWPGRAGWLLSLLGVFPAGATVGVALGAVLLLFVVVAAWLLRRHEAPEVSEARPRNPVPPRTPPVERVAASRREPTRAERRREARDEIKAWGRDL